MPLAALEIGGTALPVLPVDPEGGVAAAAVGPGRFANAMQAQDVVSDACRSLLPFPLSEQTLMAYLRYQARLRRGRTAVKNATTKPKIAKRLMRYGYTPERFAHARTLTQRAAEAHDRHKEAHGEQLEATEALEAAIEYADAMLDLHVGFARILFRDEAGIRRRLGIIGERSRTFDAWVDQATQFYTAVLDDADVMTRLRDRYHITRDMLEEGQSRVQEVIRLNQKQEAEIGEAQVATQERIEAFEALDAWVDELVAVFRLLFPDSPIDRILGRDA